MKHIVIIGAGFSGPEAAKKLSHWNVSITIMHGGEFAVLQDASKSGVARRLRNSAQVKP